MSARREIFVFGSNLAGYHGAGSALAAYQKHGAIWNQGVGLYGNSYAIPTKDRDLNVMPLKRIRPYVEDFLKFAKGHPEMTFNVVAIGCGLAGYAPAEIAPMFKEIPENCRLPKEFAWNREFIFQAQKS